MPAISVLTAKQLDLSAWARCLHEGIELLRFSGVLAPGRFQDGGVILVQENRLASRAKEAVLRLPPKPFTGAHPVLHPGEQRDRKSTRLNSSHLGISYAVFCLKKT